MNGIHTERIAQFPSDALCSGGASGLSLHRLNHGFVVHGSIFCDLTGNKRQCPVHHLPVSRAPRPHFFRVGQEALTTLEPQQSVVGIEERHAPQQQRELPVGLQQAAQGENVLQRMTGQKFVGGKHGEADGLRVTRAASGHFEKGVSVLRSKEHRVVQALGGVGQAEVPRRRVQEDARALAPNFAALRHVAQRAAEDAERLHGAEHARSER